MQLQSNCNRKERMNLIRSSLMKLPVVSANTINIEEKLQKRRIQTQNNQADEDDSDKNQETPASNLTMFQENYEVGEKIGEGTNGVVRKCLHKGTQKTYAVKFMTIDEEHRTYLKDNFKTIRSLDHPNIVKYHTIYLDFRKHTACLVMDYETMPSLRKSGTMGEEDLKVIMKQLFETLEYIHSKGMCHRDIKPENILYDPETKKIKLIDFGISKKFFVRNQRRDMLTITGALYYRAPEIFLGAGYDERVDLWSAGVTMFKMVTGKTPFESEYVSTTINSIVEGKYEFESMWAFYSKFARDCVMRLLKGRQERLTAKQTLKHFWFSKESQNPEKILTQSDSFNFIGRKKKMVNRDDIQMPRSSLIDEGKKNQDLKTEFQKWIHNDDMESIVIEIDSDEEHTPCRIKKN